MSKQTFRCAIYTRKSSDEGLDQSFNSLDAQREAGEAYVKSQAHEGWKVVPTLYDDGGFSGGSMERPALQHLLADVDAGLIDVVVVYKIDRLTRSLPDFARIVERFDAQDVSFVSVTQAFNTTSSMGRLTLNVLLSFAQFEREVTGERIRDKIAASKAKGMWMGGTVPLGYDLPAPSTRTLKINETDAETVREIFGRYLELRSVHALERELAASGVTSKARVTRSGKALGGLPINRGALFHLLRNRTYLGEIPHKGSFYPGSHLAIVDQDVFDRVGLLLDTNARRHSAAPERRVARAPLTGRLFDVDDNPMSPSFSRGKSGRHYRYYVSTTELKGDSSSDAEDKVRRINSSAIENFITGIVKRWLPGHKAPIDVPLVIRVNSNCILLDMPGDMLESIELRLSTDERVIKATRQLVRVEIAVAFPLRGGRRLVSMGHPHNAQPDPVLIAALRKAHRMLDREKRMPVLKTSPASPYDRKLLRLAFLSPDLQRDILGGRQPRSLNLERFIRLEIPLCWNEQRRVLDWHHSAHP